MSTRATGRSEWTQIKDEHLPAMGQKVLAVNWNVARKWDHYGRLVVIDLTAGSGIEEDGRPCVAFRLLDYMRERGMRADVYLCEKDRARHASLAREALRRFGGAEELRVLTYPGDCRAHVGTIVGDIGQRITIARCMAETVHGLVLVDPCGLAPWDAARRCCTAFSKLDVLLYLGAATPKWHGRTLNLPTLEQELRAFKKEEEALISEPRGNYQWVMILASSFPYGPSRRHGMDYLSGERGRSWFERANLRREQIRVRYQPSLWAEEG